LVFLESSRGIATTIGNFSYKFQYILFYYNIFTLEFLEKFDNKKGCVITIV